MNSSLLAPLSLGFSSKNTGVGCYALLQRIFPTQVSNPLLLLQPALAGSSLLLAPLGSFPDVTGKEPNCRHKRSQMLVPSLHQEDPLEEEMATYSSIRAWRIPWTEEAGRLPSMGLQTVRHDCSDLASKRYLASQVALAVKTACQRRRHELWVQWMPGSGRSAAGGNGTPLQYSRLENPTDKGDW